MIAINQQSITESANLLLEAKSGLDARTIDLSKAYPEINYLFERDGQACFSLGDIQAVKGKAKSGKSTFLIGLLATLLVGENMGFKALISGCSGMYIDTEQNPINTAKMTRKVHAICDLPKDKNDDRFVAINLRGDNPAERKVFIREAIEKYKPQFLIIDGIKDLIEGGDINAPKESGQTVQFLMTVTKEHNLAILTVLHENKNDTNMRGHVGTELLNKCSEVWQITKTDNVFDVEQTENRNEASHVLKFSFQFNDDHMPELIESLPKESVKSKNLRLRHVDFQSCLPPHQSLKYADLINEYSEKSGLAQKTAKNHITEFRRSGFLLKDSTADEYKYNYLI
jgi:hypothetical protein